jgi:hypothetical protein
MRHESNVAWRIMWHGHMSIQERSISLQFRNTYINHGYDIEFEEKSCLDRAIDMAQCNMNTNKNCASFVDLCGFCCTFARGAGALVIQAVTFFGWQWEH